MSSAGQPSAEVAQAVAVVAAALGVRLPAEQHEYLAGLPDLLTPHDVAALTGQHPETIRTLIKRGKLNGCKIGQRYYVSKPNFLDYLNGGGVDER